MNTLYLQLPKINEDITLNQTNDDIWECKKPELVIKISNDDNEFEIIKKDDLFNDINSNLIVNFFIQEYNEYKKNKIDKDSSGIEDTEEGEETKKRFTVNPDVIRLTPTPHTINTIIDMVNGSTLYEKGTIDIAPDFQRHFVWKEVEKKSRLIESILIRMPLPVFYLAETRDAKFQVVDGVQRISTIRDFFTNKFKLQGLEYLENCEGKYYKEIEPKYQRIFLSTILTCNIISADTPQQVKIEIFKRLNQGGKPLNRQEIRNSLSDTNLRQLIRRMADSEDFKLATSDSIKPLRMDDDSLVMRFIAFYLRSKDTNIVYKGDMEGFLDDIVEYLNKKTNQKSFDEIENAFYRAMKNAYYLFNNYAFRKIEDKHITHKQKPPINKSLFTAWSVLLHQYNENNIINSKGSFIDIILNVIKSNKEYAEALSVGTSQTDKLQISFDVAKKIIEENINLK